ncbi:MAG: SPOCS domain-containing protein [Oscillospiraceae bacterium]
MEELHNSKNTTISLSEVIFDGQAEQGVELDYVLPDYYPEIFKILSCRLTPRIMSYSLLGDSKMSIEGNVDIRVMYLAEGSDDIHCIEQHYTYSKTTDIGKSAIQDENDVSIRLVPRPDYCNCRAVSGRRIDVRGAVSTKITITAQKSYSLPTMPKNIQLKNKETECITKTAVSKQFSVREEIETGAKGIAYLIRCSAAPKVSDIRIISDKAVVKGTITVNAAYGIYEADKQGSSAIERMSADIPFSQILDIESIDDSFAGYADIDILDCELLCSRESGIVNCNILGVCRVVCSKQQTVMVPIDAYSTEHETEFSLGNIRLTHSLNRLSKQLSLKTELSSDSAEISSVLDCCTDIINPVCRPAGSSELCLSGMLCTKALCRTTENTVCNIEKQESFEFSIPSDNISEDTAVSFNAMCTDTDYSIKSDGGLEIISKIDFDAAVSGCENIPVIEKITVHEDRPIARDNKYALKICYANGDDNCWSIAKRYNTSIDSIKDENEITDEDMLLTGMIIIPAK